MEIPKIIIQNINQNEMFFPVNFHCDYINYAHRNRQSSNDGERQKERKRKIEIKKKTLIINK